MLSIGFFFLTCDHQHGKKNEEHATQKAKSKYQPDFVILIIRK